MKYYCKKTPHDYRNTVTFESFLTSIKTYNMTNMETLVKEGKNLLNRSTLILTIQT